MFHYFLRHYRLCFDLFRAVINCMFCGVLTTNLSVSNHVHSGIFFLVTSPNEEIQKFYGPKYVFPIQISQFTNMLTMRILAHYYITLTFLEPRMSFCNTLSGSIQSLVRVNGRKAATSNNITNSTSIQVNIVDISI
ncbi:hypothetical protein ACJX0J_034467, partial [Zea mays]